MPHHNKYIYLKILQGQINGVWADIIACRLRGSEKEHNDFIADVERLKIEEPRQYRMIARRVRIHESYNP